MIAYQTDDNGVFIGEVVCQLSPLDPEETWLIPRGAVTKTPPKFASDEQAVWNGKKWIVEPIPVADPETIAVVEEPTNG